MQYQPRYAGYEDKVHQSFARQNLMQTISAELVSIEPGLCKITAPILKGQRQQHGFAHAGLTFAIGDSAAGYSALSLMDEAAEVLTVEMKINLLAPAAGESLIAIGRVVKPGRRLIVVSAEVFARNAGENTLVALLQGTMIPTE